MARRAAARRARGEEGSLVVAVMVAAVATLLVLAAMASGIASLDTTVRAGSSAAALELADAGVNQAVREATVGGTGTPVTVTIPAGGDPTQCGQDLSCYTYSFVSAGTQPPSWHVTSVGTDSRGASRKVEADAVTDGLFPDGLFANTGMHLPAGISVDSFIDGANPADMCTGEGIVGTDDVDSMSFGDRGNGNGVTNCAGNYPVDGCVVYDDPSSTPPPSGSGECPPTKITYMPGSEPPNKGWKPQPANPEHTGGQLVCDAPLAAGTYVYQSLLVEPGCSMSGGEVDIWVSGNVQVGTGGNVGTIDPPSSCSYTGQDVFGDPASYYCKGWAADLQVYSSGSQVSFVGNHIKLWGVLDAPNAVLSTDGPQDAMWGALAVGSTSQSSAPQSSLGAQFAVHYDQSLGSIASNQIQLENWREQGCNSSCSA